MPDVSPMRNMIRAIQRVLSFWPLAVGCCTGGVAGV
jgi:hypothetical protein